MLHDSNLATMYSGFIGSGTFDVWPDTPCLFLGAFLTLHLSFSCPHLLPFYKKIVHLLPRYFPTASTYLHFRIPNI